MPRLVDRLASEPDAQAGNIHPVERAAAVEQALRLHLRRLQYGPGIGRDDIAPHADVALMHLQHAVGGFIERGRAPEALVGVAIADRADAFQLGRDAAVEDDAPLVGDQSLNASIGGGQVRRARCITAACGKRL